MDGLLTRCGQLRIKDVEHRHGGYASRREQRKIARANRAHLFIAVDEKWFALTPALSPKERAGVRASVLQPRCPDASERT
jgi:hypothetical protein